MKNLRRAIYLAVTASILAASLTGCVVYPERGYYGGGGYYGHPWYH